VNTAECVLSGVETLFAGCDVNVASTALVANTNAVQ